MRINVAATLVLLGGAALVAQSASPQQPPRFRTSVDLVHLDVSVLDRDRRPVRGLKPADFTVLEDGRPQAITVFEAFEVPDDPPPKAAWVRAVAPDVRSNQGLETGRLFLIILDDAVMQADPRAVSDGKKAARAFVEKLRGGDLAAVIFTRDNRHAQDYTADRALLLKAIDRFTIGSRDMGPAEMQWTDQLYFMFSVDTLYNAVTALSSIADRRKAIVYIGQGLPFDPGDLGAPSLGLPETGQSGTSRNANASAILRRLFDTFERARLANVNVYAMDPCGLRAPKPPSSGAAGPVPTCQPGLEVEYLRDLASGTGGRAFVNTNDLVPAVDAIYEENASYYLLGFAAERQDGKHRRLEVRVNRPGVTVRTRTGYRAESTGNLETRRARLAASPAGAALAGIVPKGDLPMQVTAVPFRVEGRKEAMVAIAAGVRQPISGGRPRTVERVELQVSAFDVNGKRHASQTMTADVSIREGASGLAEYDVLARIELKPGRYQLRLGAFVNSLAVSGSVYYDLEVPDYGSAPVSMTGILVAADPAPVAAPADAFSKWMPVIPTTRRTFAPGDSVMAFTRVYQGGKGTLAPLPLTVTLTSDSGAAVHRTTQTIAAERFARGRSADVSITLPISRLAAGEYLLTIETAATNIPVRRDLRLTIVER